jgi:L-2-hydroxyglutarate oxidase LhgO
MATRARGPESGFEVAVIGAGVIGLAVAAALTARGRSVLILEQATGFARGITSRNSEVVHAGIYYPEESLKARLCVQGRERLYAWCREHRVDARRLGKLIVATRPEEEATLEALLVRGQANGVPGLEWIDGAHVTRLEPAVSARCALHSPETGIVDAHEFSSSLLAAAEVKGAVLALEHGLEALRPRSFGWQLDVRVPTGARETIDVGLVIDAAGLDADRVAAMAGLDIDRLGWRQHPCKGDYFALAPGHSVELERLIYPVPQQAGLGIHATLDLGGRIRFGPDAVYVDRVDFAVDPVKADSFREAAMRYLPGLASAELVPDQSGIRPKLAGPGEAFRDFVVEETSSEGAPGFVACVGIESPGLTAALAIADRVADWTSV